MSNVLIHVVRLIRRMHSECQIRTILSIDDVADYAPLFTDEHTVRTINNLT